MRVHRSASLLFALLGALVVVTSACFALRPSSGGGQTKPSAQIAAGAREVDPGDVRLPEGYVIDVYAQGLTYPTGVAFDDDGLVYVVESGYAYGEDFLPPRLLRIDDDGNTTPIAVGDRAGWMGIDYDDGAFFVAEGGVTLPGRILRIDVTGDIEVLADDLPSLGDHHVNGPAVRDGFVYFGIGTATNSGIVGDDNADFGWLKRAPAFHDVPCRDVVLNGHNARTPNPLTPDPDDTALTGAFVPFNTTTERGQIVRGRIPCSGAVLRVPIDGAHDGSDIELVAWGFRNPFGLAFAPDGRLFVTDNGFDERGARPVFGAGDVLWSVDDVNTAPDKAPWYGWPDFAEARPVSRPRYAREGQPAPARLLVDVPNEPPAPAAIFAVHSSSNGVDFARNGAFGHAGEAFVAQFGDQAPVVGKVWAPVGFKVVRVDVQTGVVRDFATNDSTHPGPASRRGLRGLERPVAVRFDPAGTSLYVVDFGVLRMDREGAHPVRNTGVVWRIGREQEPLARK